MANQYAAMPYNPNDFTFNSLPALTNFNQLIDPNTKVCCKADSLDENEKIQSAP